MRSGFKNTIVRIVAWACMMSFLALIVNDAVFLHVHKLDDGTLLLHAHPFNKASDSAKTKHHQHSQDELFFIHNLHLLFFVTFIGIFIAAPVSLFLSFTEHLTNRTSLSVHFLYGRPPPRNLFFPN